MRRFHELFFGLSPQKDAIEHNINRALQLADRSAYHYYVDFAEKGYYNRLVSGNINRWCMWTAWSVISPATPTRR